MSKKRLSPSVIKSAIDGLPTGLAFADPAGRIRLMNRAMARLGSALLGSYPQTRQELEEALARPRRAVRIEDDPPLYRFPDGTVWRFQTVTLAQPAGYTQTTAQDMTELYEGARQLRRDNEELRQISRDMKEMYARMGDRVRDSETLELKMRIHNNIGASLITLTGLLEQGSPAELDAQLDLLQDAVSYLTRDRETPDGTRETLDGARAQAAEMGVALVIRGEAPEDAALARMAAAAIRECVTNCVKHAAGDRVEAVFARQKGGFTLTVTNNGAPPAGPIAEGGGLSSLRDKIEAGGGEMALTWEGGFTLTLRLPEGESG